MKKFSSRQTLPFRRGSDVVATQKERKFSLSNCRVPRIMKASCLKNFFYNNNTFRFSRARYVSQNSHCKLLFPSSIETGQQSSYLLFQIIVKAYLNSLIFTNEFLMSACIQLLCNIKITKGKNIHDNQEPYKGLYLPCFKQISDPTIMM